MKMKKYNAPSIAEAMKKVRADLGEDAVIINSKVIIDKKFFGLIKKKSFEVVAGIDEQIDSKPMLSSFNELPFFQQEKTQPLKKETNEVQAQENVINSELKKEIADLKTMMQTMHRQSIQSKYPDELLRFIDYLKRQELNEELITEISDELFNHLQNNVVVNEDDFHYITEKIIKRHLLTIELGGVSYDKKYINILGPTGVGKTTTIAKMAARAVLEKKKKVGFITTDTYRIAAIEQLKTYASLLQIPLEVVYNADDYKNAIGKFEHLDVVFIDTAGRNYKEAKYVDDLKRLISFDEQVETFLVLSLTAKEADLDAIIQQFEKINMNKFIFTKTDETNSIGTLFNLMIKYKKGLAYYTDGQEVPEDIVEPTFEKLFELFFQGTTK